MPTEVILVRHGQTSSNITGYYMGRSNEEMDSAGLVQTQRLSSRLANLPITSIYSSPLQRAYSTARVIAEPRSLKIKVLDDLTEIDFGEWQGLHMQEIKEKWPELWSEWRKDPSHIAIPGGETFSQIAVRSSRVLNLVIAENRGSTSIIASHEIVIKSMLIQALGASYSIFRRFEISNASISRLQVRGENLHVVTINDKYHLDNQI
jgi:broad specificity phosphatase PhoE